MRVKWDSDAAFDPGQSDYAWVEMGKWEGGTCIRNNTVATLLYVLIRNSVKGYRKLHGL